MSKNFGEYRSSNLNNHWISPRPSWKTRVTASLILPLFTASIIGSTTPVWAGEQVTGDPNAVNTAALKPATVNCDDFCSKLVAAVPLNSTGSNNGVDFSTQANQQQYSLNPSTGSGGWNTNADQWCANHGVGTDPSIMATATPAPISTAAAGSATSCDVPLLPGDTAIVNIPGQPAFATACQSVAARMFMCQMQNTQVIPACLAYEAAQGAVGFEPWLLALDVVGAGICGTACALDAMSPDAAKPDVGKPDPTDDPLGQPGNAPPAARNTLPTGTTQAQPLNNPFSRSLTPAGGGGGVLPNWTMFLTPSSIFHNLLPFLAPPTLPKDSSPDPVLRTIQNDRDRKQTPLLEKARELTLKKRAEHLLGMPIEIYLALSAAGVVAPPANAGTADFVCQAAAATVGAVELGNMMVMMASKSETVAGAISAVAGVGGGALGAVNLITQGTKQIGSNTNDTKGSCVTAIILGVTAGVRAYDYIQIQNTKNAACSNVQSLASSAMGSSTAASTTPTGTTTNGLYNNVPGAAGVGLTGSGGSTGTVTGSTSSIGAPTSGIPCATGSCNLPTASQATEGGMLTNSGLGNMAAGPAASILPQLQHALDSGSGIGAAMQGAMGGGAGALGNALAGLAQAAQDDGAKYISGTNGSGAYAGGGGGGAKSAGGDSSNPFASLFGGATKDAGVRGPASEQFGKAAQTDIWHTGTTQNLFQIISDKVSKVANRVGSR